MDWPELDVSAGGTIEEFHQQSIDAFLNLSEKFSHEISAWPGFGGNGEAAPEQSEGGGSSPSPSGGHASEEIQSHWFSGDGEGI